MPKIKKHYDDNFTIIGNSMFKDRMLSLKARGLLATMLSLPESWVFSVKGLASILPNGEGSITTALHELERLGYLKRIRRYNGSKYSKVDYIFDDIPLSLQSISDMEINVKQSSEEAVSGKENCVCNQVHSYQIHINKESIDKESIDQSPEENFDERTDDKYTDKDYYTALIKEKIGFGYFADWLNSLTDDECDEYEEAEKIVGLIVKEICSRSPERKICGEMYSRSEIRSTLLNVNEEILESVMEKMSEKESHNNYEGYFISTLFNEINVYLLKERNEQRWAEKAINQYYNDNV